MSNLLDKASIILTPTAYDNGKVLCVKPSTSPYGDFDFSRNSSATRVNAQGLIEDVQILSSNLVQNGDFATDTDWTKGTGWSIGSGVATSDGTTSNLDQSSVLTTSASYKATVTVSNMTIGALSFRLGSTSGDEAINITSNGTYTFYGVAGGTTLRLRSQSSFDGSVTNISVIEITDDTNLPRINYSGFSYDGSGNIVANSGCGAWLFEPQSTNLITYSEELDNAAWAKRSSGGGSVPIVTADVATSPDGTTNADRVVFDAAGGTSGDQSFIRQSVSVTSGVNYIISFYLKSNTASSQQILFLRDSAVSAAITVTTSWTRFDLSFTAASTATTNWGLFLNGDTSASADLLVYGAQLEEGSYATSYIPTSGSTVTRNQDLCTNGGDASLINSEEGVLYVEIAALADDGTNKRLTINQNTTNRIGIEFNTSGQLRFTVRIAGSFAVSAVFSADITVNNKIAFKYKSGDNSFYLNGVNIGNFAGTFAFAVGQLSKLDFSDGGNIEMFGKTKALGVWKEALTDAELTALTTI